MDLTDPYLSVPMSSAPPWVASRRSAPIDPPQPLEAETVAVALLGVGPGLEESFDEGGRVGSDLEAPGDQPRRGPTEMGTVGDRHVRGIRRLSAFPVAAEADGDAEVVEDHQVPGRGP